MLHEGAAVCARRIAKAKRPSISLINHHHALESAGGRVWTGEDALKAGLVDRIGGLAESVATARELAKIPPERATALVPFPAERDFFEIVTEELFGTSAPATRRGVATLLRAVDTVAPLAERLAPLIEARERRLLAPEAMQVR